MAATASRTGGQCQEWPSVRHAVRARCVYQLITLGPERSPDGKVCINEFGELAVTKFAVEPVGT